jgi:hypothetical protein
MDDKNIVINTYKLHQVSLDIEALICCLIVDLFLAKRGKIPFVSILYYILLKNINSQISNQNFINTIKRQKRKEKVIMSDDNQQFISEDNFQYGKKYYFDKSGMDIDESEANKIHCNCKKVVETCCRLQIPSGFKLANRTPGMCFNLSNLSCVKSPIVQKVTVTNCECKHSMQCEVVAGYEVRAVGDVNFSVSLPICPLEGFCFPTNSHISCTSTVPVNKVISYTCCPKPCPCKVPCVDWTYAYFSAKIAEDCCGPYIEVELGVVLEYTGVCDCDEE